MSDTSTLPASATNQTFHKVQQLLQQILALESPDSIRADARLREDLNVDSLGMVDVVLGVEEAFGVRFGSDINLFDRVVTVGDAVKLIEELTSARSN